MRISVVIPAFNEEKHIAKCLDHLIAQTEKPDEILVVDNNSTDATASIAKKYRTFGIRVIREKVQGMTPARNRGFNSAKYEIIARTDADTLVPPNWIKRIKSYFEKDKKLIALSGPSDFHTVPKFVQKAQWTRKVLFTSFRMLTGYTYMYGPNMAIKKSAWEKIKNEVCLEDSEVHEDMDLAVHLGKNGKVKFYPSLIVISSPRRLKHVTSYYEYPYRYIKTVQLHKEMLPPRKQREFMKKFMSKSKKFFKDSGKFLST